MKLFLSRSPPAIRWPNPAAISPFTLPRWCLTPVSCHSPFRSFSVATSDSLSKKQALKKKKWKRKKGKKKNKEKKRKKKRKQTSLAKGKLEVPGCQCLQQEPSANDNGTDAYMPYLPSPLMRWLWHRFCTGSQRFPVGLNSVFCSENLLMNKPWIDFPPYPILLPYSFLRITSWINYLQSIPYLKSCFW